MQFRIPTQLRKKQYLYGGGGVLLTLLVVLSVWLVPFLRAQAASGYHSARHIVLGEEDMETPVTPLPSFSPSPTVSVADRITALENQIATLTQQVTQAQTALADSQAQLKTSSDEVAASRSSLLKAQAEWVMALKQANVSVPSPLPISAEDPTPLPGDPSPTDSSPGLINLNTATADQLDSLPGIGAAYAQRIIDYRNQKGPFNKIEDVQNVAGIGPSTFAKIKDKITV